MTNSPLRVLVTGAHGFIGKNLVVRLKELPQFTVSEYVRDNSIEKLPEMLSEADAVIHLAGENRPSDESAFAEINTGLTEALCVAIETGGRNIPLILASSTQALLDNAYGRSKLAAEKAVEALSARTGNPATIFRLPGVFGKWCRPNYNSVVATFSHNIACDLPVRVDNPDATLKLVYVDDVVSAFVAALEAPTAGTTLKRVTPEYSITLGELASQLEAFHTERDLLKIDRVGTGLIRALYATYISYLPRARFVYDIPCHADQRGVFVEMLKTSDSGQFSFFTANPGITRGGHYHHTKTEKFLVLRGEAVFRFRHLLTDEKLELRTSGKVPQVVETIPGWSHDITNMGDDEMIVMLWANEIFDQDRPDTISSPV